jgi:hypothetical protein
MEDDKKLFVELGIPYTRDEWIASNWLGTPPEPWPAEAEMELPEDLRDWSLFKFKQVDEPQQVLDEDHP